MPSAPTSSPLPLLILKTGDTFESLREVHGDFEHWIAQGFKQPAMPVLVLDPRRGDLLPSSDEIAGVIVTGSHAMVSHREAWSERTAAWLAGVVAQDDVPVLGICYGHQLLAHALQGEAGDHPTAMEIGTVQVCLHDEAAHDPLFNGMPAQFDAHVVHQQSALQLPPGAVLLASNDFEPHQAFRLGSCAWGVQFHPEFDETAMRGYIDALADGLGAPDTLSASVRATPESASLLARFAGIVASAREARQLPAAESAC